MRVEPFDMEFDALSKMVIGAALEVHSALGPGLFERVYKTVLGQEIHTRGFSVKSEVEVPVVYDGLRTPVGYRIDILVDDTLIIEIKAVESLLPVHKAQLLTYLKFSGKPVGLLFNFNTAHLRQGIVRMVNSAPRPTAIR